MQETILNKLHEIEQEKHVRILLAVESGSRAWGFASPDSDYDVRFIYAREPQDYLRLKKTRDVIEYPINDLLDINGWDLDKTFILMHNGNPTIGEWLQSPIVYQETPSADLLRQAYAMCFSEKKSIYHYLSTALRSYHEQVEDHAQVKAKKYFYILRPLLCSRYILREHKAKPVEAASTEMFMMSGDSTVCRTEITGDTGADVFYTETLCSQHGMTDMMTGFVLAGADDTTTAMKQIGLLWRSEMDIIQGALPEENAVIITYDLGTTRIWLEAREDLLQLLYPKQEAAVTNIINDTIKQRVTTLCEEVNK